MGLAFGLAIAVSGDAAASDIVDRAIINAAHISLAVDECEATLTPEGVRIVRLAKAAWPDRIEGTKIETAVLAIQALKGAGRPITIRSVRQLLCATLEGVFAGDRAKALVVFKRGAAQ